MYDQNNPIRKNYLRQKEETKEQLTRMRYTATN